MKPAAKTDWPEEIHSVLEQSSVHVVGYVPDAGHKKLIEMCHDCASMRAVPLTTEEEGIGLATGAWLGGERTVLLMQSSGVGNIINTLGIVSECRIPLPMIITMRGEYGEFNPWQLPMGQATPEVLRAMGVVVKPVDDARDAAAEVDAALRLAYNGYAAVAVLISQRVIGIKSFQEQAEK